MISPDFVHCAKIANTVVMSRKTRVATKELNSWRSAKRRELSSNKRKCIPLALVQTCSSKNGQESVTLTHSNRLIDVSWLTIDWRSCQVAYLEGLFFWFIIRIVDGLCLVLCFHKWFDLVKFCTTALCGQWLSIDWGSC